MQYAYIPGGMWGPVFPFWVQVMAQLSQKRVHRESTINSKSSNVRAVRIFFYRELSLFRTRSQQREGCMKEERAGWCNQLTWTTGDITVMEIDEQIIKKYRYYCLPRALPSLSASQMNAHKIHTTANVLGTRDFNTWAPLLLYRGE